MARTNDFACLHQEDSFLWLSSKGDRYGSFASRASYWLSSRRLLFAAKFDLRRHTHHQRELAIKDDDKCALCYVNHWAKTGEFRK